jgi:hypothetical protein
MPLDRIEADIKALQQQALTTQASIQQLQTRPSTDPLTAILSEVPTVPVVDTTAIGGAIVLITAFALAWRYFWQRPKAMLARDESEHAENNDPQSVFGTLHEPEPESHYVTAQEQVFRDKHKTDTPLGFDSEAAAHEVIRVRKSLADKREARAQQRERNDESTIAPLPTMDKGPVSDWQAPDLSDPDAFMSMAQSSQTESKPEPESQHAVGPDYAVTFALAQESETLELWNEARELAEEALGTSDAAMREKVLALIQRMDTKTQEIAQDSQLLDIEI